MNRVRTNSVVVAYQNIQYPLIYALTVRNYGLDMFKLVSLVGLLSVIV